MFALAATVSLPRHFSVCAWWQNHKTILLCISAYSLIKDWSSSGVTCVWILSFLLKDSQGYMQYVSCALTWLRNHEFVQCLFIVFSLCVCVLSFNFVSSMCMCVSNTAMKYIVKVTQILRIWNDAYNTFF